MAESAMRAVSGPPRVDTHAHIFSRAMPYVPEAHAQPDYEYPAESWLADMARFGITHGVVAAASLWGDYNDYTLAALRDHPNLRGTVIVSPETSAQALRALADQGVVGVRLTWRRAAALPDPTTGPWPGFLRRLADAGLHAQLLVNGQDLPALLPAFLESGVQLVVDHFGVPPQDLTLRAAMQEALTAAIDSGRVWTKVSAGFRVADEVAVESAAWLLAKAGPERLLWGSDAPFVNYENSIDYAGALALYERLVPNATDRATIDETALKLFF